MYVTLFRELIFFFLQDLTLHKKPVVKERRPNTPRIIYVAGGYFRHSIDLFEAFNLDDSSWTTLPRLTVPRSGLGAVFLKVNDLAYWNSLCFVSPGIVESESERFIHWMALKKQLMKCFIFIFIKVFQRLAYLNSLSKFNNNKYV